MVTQSSNEILNTLNALLAEAIALDHAEKGLLQYYDKEKSLLRVAAQKGFTNNFLHQFKEVKAFDPSAYGRSLGLKIVIVIDDIMHDLALMQYWQVFRMENFRSVKAIPLFAEDNEIVGVLSTHFKEPQYLLQKKGDIPPKHLLKISRYLKKLLDQYIEKNTAAA